MPWDKESGCFERGNWLVQPIEQWSQFWQNCNWYTFHPLTLELENDVSLGGIEVTLVILGIGLRWRWNHSSTPLRDQIVRDVAAIKAGELETYPLDFPGQR